MSAIASFHVLPAEILNDIVAAATPVPGGPFRPARDTFYGRLARIGPRIGDICLVQLGVDLYLESRNGLTYANFGDAAASRQLSQARSSDWLVLPAASVAELPAALDRVECEAADVTAFVAGEHGPADAADAALAARVALTTLKGWLTEVSPGSVGLLSVG